MNNARLLKNNKVCFIACVNDEFFYEESVLYIKYLHVPAGMQVDLLAVRGAESMAAGYQAAMEASDAKYKIYIHQDVFIVNPNLLSDIINVFCNHPEIGLLGTAGTVTLDMNNPVWWENSTRCGKAYSKKSPEEIQMDVFGEFAGDFLQVDALDGIFLATQYDIPWRTDLFRGWHFYDISQSQEFIKQGYQVVIANQVEPWLIHACGRKVMDDEYVKNMEIFQQNYA